MNRALWVILLNQAVWAKGVQEAVMMGEVRNAEINLAAMSRMK